MSLHVQHMTIVMTQQLKGVKFMKRLNSSVYFWYLKLQDLGSVDLHYKFDVKDCREIYYSICT